jgi:hypothetical protein
MPTRHENTHFGKKMIQAIFDVFEPESAVVLDSSGTIKGKKKHPDYAIPK